MAAEADEPAKATAGTSASRRRSFPFGRDSRILSRARFEELYALPAGRAGRFLVFRCAPAPAGTAVHRLGATAAKRTFRDAHERNRAKRLLRESFRLLRPGFEGGPWDLVLVARRAILRAKEPDVRAELAERCRAAGILPAARVEGLPPSAASESRKVGTSTFRPSGPSDLQDPKPEISP